MSNLYDGLFERCVITLDTLYLVAKVPDDRVYLRWWSELQAVEHKLKGEGVPVDEFVCRGGASGYKFSLWFGDARVFVARSVDMGLWVQLGPKFLALYADKLRVMVIDLLCMVGCPAEWFALQDVGGVRLMPCPINVNRVDVAVDCLGHDLSGMTIDGPDGWNNGWVGYSKPTKVFYGVRGLETVQIGSRESAVFARCYDKVAEAVKTGDIDYWRLVWGDWQGPVTRFEWQVSIKSGGFDEFKDFYRWSDVQMISLLNYLVAWGSLRVPDEGRRDRWELSAFWDGLLTGCQKYADGESSRAVRVYKTPAEISDAYVKFLSGAISGGMARFAGKQISLVELLEGMSKRGHGLERLQLRALERWEILYRLGKVEGSV